MTPEPKSDRIDRKIEDYQSDADHMISIYNNPKLPDDNPNLLHYKTTETLRDYINIKKYTSDEIDFIMKLIKGKSRGVLDPYVSPLFKLSLVEAEDHEKN